jgi:hypothetical protein
MKKAAVRFLMLFAGLLVFYVVGVVARGRYGIRVLVGNRSGETLRRVVLKEEIHGPRYELGDFRDGFSRHIFIRPKTESHIAMDFQDAAGTPHSELVVGYLESGYCGSAEAVVEPGGKVMANEHVDILFCKGSWLDFFR